MLAKYLLVKGRLALVAMPVTLLFASVGVSAEQTLLPWLAPYSGSQSIRFSQAETPDYVLALGKLKTVDAIWRLDAEQRLAGQLQRETWRIPAGHSANQALEYLDAQFGEHNATTLYACDGRECGSSNQWANLVFQERQLYGLEQRQFYRAYKLASAKQTIYAALYLVQRGNKRVYAHVDLLAETGMPALSARLLQRLQARGKLRLLEPVDDKGVLQPDTAVQLQQLANQLLAQKGGEGGSDAQPGGQVRKLWVVGHSYSASTVDANQNAALSLAETVKSALQAAGIPASQLSTYSLGPLARLAGKNRAKARVEILVAE